MNPIPQDAPLGVSPPPRRPKRRAPEMNVPEELRRAFFKLVRVREGGIDRRLYAIEVYFRHLVNEAARGNLSAHREMMALVQYTDRRELKRAQLEKAECSISREIAKNEAMFGIVQQVRGQLFLDFRELFREAYREIRDDLPDFDRIMIPDIICSERAIAAARPIRPKSVESGGGGYGKPPREHRFQPGQSGNPSGLRKIANQDVLIDLTKSLTKTLVVTDSTGTRSKSTMIGVACTQLIAKAIKGSPGARKQLRAIIYMLDSLGKLKPTPPRPAKIDDKTMVDMVRGMRRLIFQVSPDIFDAMVSAYGIQYGKLPAPVLAVLRGRCVFMTDIE